MVHSSMRRVGRILGGPNVVIEALLRVLEPGGTMMMYTDWEDAAQSLMREDRDGSVPSPWLEEWPAFDPATARASRDHGILVECFRTWPGAHRSGNPGASVAAVGARAAWLCADHPLDYGYGPGSPLAKLVEVEGRVLLLGSPLQNLTLLHHSEHVARLENKRVIRYREKLLRAGVGEWVDIEEYDTSHPVVGGASEDYFGEIVEDYLRTGRAHTGPVGAAEAYLFEGADLHAHAVEWLEARWGRSTEADRRAP